MLCHLSLVGLLKHTTLLYLLPVPSDLLCLSLLLLTRIGEFLGLLLARSLSKLLNRCRMHRL